MKKKRYVIFINKSETDPTGRFINIVDTEEVDGKKTMWKDLLNLLSTDEVTQLLEYYRREERVTEGFLASQAWLNYEIFIRNEDFIQWVMSLAISERKYVSIKLEGNSNARSTDDYNHEFVEHVNIDNYNRVVVTLTDGRMITFFNTSKGTTEVESVDNGSKFIQLVIE
jgi:hypothetical protein